MKGGAVIARGVTFTSGTPDVPYSGHLEKFEIRAG